jgi:site-specific DNA recombinase
MKRYASYVRVSSVRQGEQGVSLVQQTAAIKRYAEQHNLVIAHSFEEQETAAKRGRPIFEHMLRLLRDGRLAGVIIHKIDRSARNLKDWADLGELIDQGVEIHFANEALDLTSRGGRLSADIQAVVAADYIRNLRDEAKKGIYGRLGQGIYPMPAPIGYLDVGAGKPKIPDPVKAPLVRVAFERYATGDIGFRPLQRELHHRGLTGRSGRPLSRNQLSAILRNPFYIGTIRLKKTGQTFVGLHEPIITHHLFNQVQAVIDGKPVPRPSKHAFIFAGLLNCGNCERRRLVGELQKGLTYYRCHNQRCAGQCVREEVLEDELLKVLRSVRLSEDELASLHQLSEMADREALAADLQQRTLLAVQLDGTETHLQRLLTAYLEGSVESADFAERKQALQRERERLRAKLDDQSFRPAASQQLVRMFELANNPDLLYQAANQKRKRELVKLMCSNCTVTDKIPAFKLISAFQIIAERETSRMVGHPEPMFERLNRLLKQLIEAIAAQPPRLDPLEEAA